MIENNYAITIVLEYVDGHLEYLATAAKFPKLMVYRKTPIKAYNQAVSYIKTLVELDIAAGKQIPEPDYKESMMGQSNTFQWVNQQTDY